MEGEQNSTLGNLKLSMESTFIANSSASFFGTSHLLSGLLSDCHGFGFDILTFCCNSLAGV